MKPTGPLSLALPLRPRSGREPKVSNRLTWSKYLFLYEKRPRRRSRSVVSATYVRRLSPLSWMLQSSELVYTPH